MTGKTDLDYCKQCSYYFWSITHYLSNRDISIDSSKINSRSIEFQCIKFLGKKKGILFCFCF